MKNENQTSLPVQDEQVVTKKRSQLKEVWRRFCRNKQAMIGLAMLFLLIFAAVFANVIAPYDPVEQNLLIRLQGPSAAHWFGTDELGRDIFSRILYGARISLTVGLIAVSISCVAGMCPGSYCGYYGGILDTVIMRISDIMMAIPSILLNISIVAALGTGLQNVMIAIGISSVPAYCRIMRASLLSLKNQEFVDASRVAGSTDFYIIMHHIIPNSLAPLIVQATLKIGGAILSCASMSFIGLGIVPPTPEWGAMLSTGRDFLRDAPHLTAFPGLAIMFAVFSWNLIGDLRQKRESLVH